MRSIGPIKSQQMSPGAQHEEPQQVAPTAQACPLQGIGPHVPPMQKELGGTHSLPQPPQLCGSLSGSMQVTPLQHLRPGWQLGQLPPGPPLDVLDPPPEPLLVPPELLPDEPPLDPESVDASAPLGAVTPPQPDARATSTQAPTCPKAFGMDIPP
jgi:hypothetical protein